MQELSDHNGSYNGWSGNTAGTYTVRVSSHYIGGGRGGGGGGGREEEASWRSPLNWSSRQTCTIFSRLKNLSDFDSVTQ